MLVFHFGPQLRCGPAPLDRTALLPGVLERKKEKSRKEVNAKSPQTGQKGQKGGGVRPRRVGGKKKRANKGKVR